MSTMLISSLISIIVISIIIGTIYYFQKDKILEILRGDQGGIGLQGETGIQGEAGSPGEIGPRGEIGPQGEIGPRGETGPRGEIGPPGPRGEIGPQGKVGKTGPIGKTGPRGYGVDKNQLKMMDSFQKGFLKFASYSKCLQVKERKDSDGSKIIMCPLGYKLRGIKNKKTGDVGECCKGFGPLLDSQNHPQPSPKTKNTWTSCFPLTQPAVISAQFKNECKKRGLHYNGERQMCSGKINGKQTMRGECINNQKEKYELVNKKNQAIISGGGTVLRVKNKVSTKKKKYILPEKIRNNYFLGQV